MTRERERERESESECEREGKVGTLGMYSVRMYAQTSIHEIVSVPIKAIIRPTSTVMYLSQDKVRGEQEYHSFSTRYHGHLINPTSIILHMNDTILRTLIPLLPPHPPSPQYSA